jgi:hypothetical protein
MKRNTPHLKIVNLISGSKKHFLEYEKNNKKLDIK